MPSTIINSKQDNEHFIKLKPNDKNEPYLLIKRSRFLSIPFEKLKFETKTHEDSKKRKYYSIHAETDTMEYYGSTKDTLQPHCKYVL
jgi:hypothetical protein